MKREINYDFVDV